VELLSHVSRTDPWGEQLRSGKERDGGSAVGHGGIFQFHEQFVEKALQFLAN
jgi:hypothetical protein